jgi:hypothetical protein
MVKPVRLNLMNPPNGTRQSPGEEPTADLFINENPKKLNERDDGSRRRVYGQHPIRSSTNTPTARDQVVLHNAASLPNADESVSEQFCGRVTGLITLCDSELTRGRNCSGAEPRGN